MMWTRLVMAEDCDNDNEDSAGNNNYLRSFGAGPLGNGDTGGLGGGGAHHLLLGQALLHSGEIVIISIIMINLVPG